MDFFNVTRNENKRTLDDRQDGDGTLKRCGEVESFLLCEIFPGHYEVICSICKDRCVGKKKGKNIPLINDLTVAENLKCECGNKMHKYSFDNRQDDDGSPNDLNRLNNFYNILYSNPSSSLADNFEEREKTTFSQVVREKLNNSKIDYEMNYQGNGTESTDSGLSILKQVGFLLNEYRNTELDHNQIFNLNMLFKSNKISILLRGFTNWISDFNYEEFLTKDGLLGSITNIETKKNLLLLEILASDPNLNFSNPAIFTEEKIQGLKILFTKIQPEPNFNHYLKFVVSINLIKLYFNSRFSKIQNYLNKYDLEALSNFDICLLNFYKYKPFSVKQFYTKYDIMEPSLREDDLILEVTSIISKLNSILKNMWKMSEESLTIRAYFYNVYLDIHNYYLSFCNMIGNSKTHQDASCFEQIKDFLLLSAEVLQSSSTDELISKNDGLHSDEISKVQLNLLNLIHIYMITKVDTHLISVISELDSKKGNSEMADSSEILVSYFIKMDPKNSSILTLFTEILNKHLLSIDKYFKIDISDRGSIIDSTEYLSEIRPNEVSIMVRRGIEILKLFSGDISSRIVKLMSIPDTNLERSFEIKLMNQDAPRQEDKAQWRYFSSFRKEVLAIKYYEGNGENLFSGICSWFFEFSGYLNEAFQVRDSSLYLQGRTENQFTPYILAFSKLEIVWKEKILELQTMALASNFFSYFNEMLELMSAHNFHISAIDGTVNIFNVILSLSYLNQQVVAQVLGLDFKNFFSLFNFENINSYLKSFLFHLAHNLTYSHITGAVTNYNFSNIDFISFQLKLIICSNLKPKDDSPKIELKRKTKCEINIEIQQANDDNLKETFNKMNKTEKLSDVKNLASLAKSIGNNQIGSIVGNQANGEIQFDDLESLQKNMTELNALMDIVSLICLKKGDKIFILELLNYLSHSIIKINNNYFKHRGKNYIIQVVKNRGPDIELKFLKSYVKLLNILKESCIKFYGYLGAKELIFDPQEVVDNIEILNEEYPEFAYDLIKFVSGYYALPDFDITQSIETLKNSFHVNLDKSSEAFTNLVFSPVIKEGEDLKLMSIYNNYDNLFRYVKVKENEFTSHSHYSQFVRHAATARIRELCPYKGMIKLFDFIKFSIQKSINYNTSCNPDEILNEKLVYYLANTNSSISTCLSLIFSFAQLINMRMSVAVPRKFKLPEVLEKEFKQFYILLRDLLTSFISLVIEHQAKLRREIIILSNRTIYKRINDAFCLLNDELANVALDKIQEIKNKLETSQDFNINDLFKDLGLVLAQVVKTDFLKAIREDEKQTKYHKSYLSLENTSKLIKDKLAAYTKAKSFESVLSYLYKSDRQRSSRIFRFIILDLINYDYIKGVRSNNSSILTFVKSASTEYRNTETNYYSNANGSSSNMTLINFNFLSINLISSISLLNNLMEVCSSHGNSLGLDIFEQTIKENENTHLKKILEAVLKNMILFYEFGFYSYNRTQRLSIDAVVSRLTIKKCKELKSVEGECIIDYFLKYDYSKEQKQVIDFISKLCKNDFFLEKILLLDYPAEILTTDCKSELETTYKKEQLDKAMEYARNCKAFTYYNLAFYMINRKLFENSRHNFDFSLIEKIKTEEKDNKKITYYDHIMSNLNQITATTTKWEAQTNKELLLPYGNDHFTNHFSALLSFTFKNCFDIFNIKPFNKGGCVYLMYKGIRTLNFMLKRNYFTQETVFNLVQGKLFNLPDKIFELFKLIVNKYKLGVEYDNEVLFKQQDHDDLNVLSFKDKRNKEQNVILDEFIDCYYKFVNADYSNLVNNQNPELLRIGNDVVIGIALELYLFLNFLVGHFNYSDIYFETYNVISKKMTGILKCGNFIINSNSSDCLEPKTPITLYYYVNPICKKYITEDEILNFNKTVDRSTPLSKLQGLLTKIKEVTRKIRYDQKMKEPQNTQNTNQNSNEQSSQSQDNGSLSDFVLKGLAKCNNFNLGDYINFVFAIGINICFFLMEGYDRKIYPLLYALIVLQFLMNLVFITNFFQHRYWFKVSIAKLNTTGEDVWGLDKDKSDAPPVNEQDRINQENKEKELREISRKKQNILQEYVWTPIFGDDEIYYFIICFIVSLLGLIFSNHAPLLFTFQLLGITKFNSTSKGIISAFAIRANQMTAMLLLLFLITNFFAMFGFFMMQSEAKVTLESGEKVNVCESLITCAINYFNYGVRAGGGIGDVLSPNSMSEGTWYWIRLINDFLFFLVITLLVVQMFSGIIIETFGSLREEQELMNDDKENKCFICSVRNVEFKRRNLKFKNHVESEHVLSDYMLILLSFMLLKKEEVEKLDFNEKIVADSIKNNKFDCFPINMIINQGKCIPIRDE